MMTRWVRLIRDEANYIDIAMPDLGARPNIVVYGSGHYLRDDDAVTPIRGRLEHVVEAVYRMVDLVVELDVEATYQMSPSPVRVIQK